MQINRTWRRRQLRLLKWLVTNHQHLILTAIFGLAFFAVIYALHVSNSYEEKRYDGKHYADSIDFITAIVEAESECNKNKEKRQSGYCKVLSDLISERADLHDLGAQETMALATRGLLHMGMLQTIALFLTLAFVVLAVMQTHAMLVEARKTTKAAKKSLKETRLGNRAVVNYVTFTEPLFHDRGNAIGVRFVFTNFGATPATDFRFCSKCLLHDNTKKEYPRRIKINSHQLREVGNQQIIAQSQQIEIPITFSHPTLEKGLLSKLTSLLVAIKLSYRTIHGELESPEFLIRFSFDYSIVPHHMPQNTPPQLANAIVQTGSKNIFTTQQLPVIMELVGVTEDTSTPNDQPKEYSFAEKIIKWILWPV